MAFRLSPAFIYTRHLQGTLAGSPNATRQFNRSTDITYGGPPEGQQRYARFVPVLTGPHRRVLCMFTDGRWKGPFATVGPGP